MASPIPRGLCVSGGGPGLHPEVGDRVCGFGAPCVVWASGTAQGHSGGLQVVTGRSAGDLQDTVKGEPGIGEITEPLVGSEEVLSYLWAGAGLLGRGAGRIRATKPRGLTLQPSTPTIC